MSIVIIMAPLFLLAALVDTIYTNRKRICKAIETIYAIVFAYILCLTGKA